MTGIATGSKAASGGKQGCSSRVCGTGMEQAKAAEQGQQQRKPNRQGTKSVWNDSGLDGVAWAEFQEDSSRILLVICKTEEISQHMWVSADGAYRLRKISLEKSILAPWLKCAWQRYAWTQGLRRLMSWVEPQNVLQEIGEKQVLLLWHISGYWNVSSDSCPAVCVCSWQLWVLHDPCLKPPQENNLQPVSPTCLLLVAACDSFSIQ